MLVVSNVTKKYGKLVANDNVTFTAEGGEVSLLLGPNGAGKTTLIKCISGLLRFTGSIEICGYGNKTLQAKRYFGYIPEVPALYDMLTVWEHLEFIARAYSLENWEGRADQLLERFELDDKKKKLGRELSKGMQQKLSICCGILSEPKVILFDEPMVGLDPHAIKELKNLIVEQKQAGNAVLISTHMLDSVADFWDSTNIMMDGKIVDRRKRREMEAAGENLEDVFFRITKREND
ncbi:MAG: ABC transporter ATP-binding protein [Clostridiales bacterium]|nr:ABC transporter ATP-binding protein [Clostridiales bacterium]